MPKVVATTSFTYKGVAYNKGDTLTVKPNLVQAWIDGGIVESSTPAESPVATQGGAGEVVDAEPANGAADTTKEPTTPPEQPQGEAGNSDDATPAGAADADDKKVDEKKGKK